MAGVVRLRDAASGRERTAFAAFPEYLESIAPGVFLEPVEEPIVKQPSRSLRYRRRDGSWSTVDGRTAEAPAPLSIANAVSAPITGELAERLREKITASEPRKLAPWISVADASRVIGLRNAFEFGQLFAGRQIAEINRRNPDGTWTSGVWLGSLARLLRNQPQSSAWSPGVNGHVQAITTEDRTRATLGTMPVLRGHAAVFGQWTEIDSFYEGRFMERMAPGAFRATLADPHERPTVRCLFNHGLDPQIDQKPLGPIEVLREDETGLYYEVPLLDTSYNRELIPGLRDGVYGASVRFKVVAEDLDPLPGRSAHNPEGLPEATVRQVVLKEFGPVTFPAYKAATAELAIAGAA